MIRDTIHAAVQGTNVSHFFFLINFQVHKNDLVNKRILCLKLEFLT